MMRLKHLHFPDWLQNELLKRTYAPDFNDLVALLLEDYIERKQPKPAPLPMEQIGVDKSTKPAPKAKKPKCKTCNGKGLYMGVVPPGKSVKTPCFCKEKK